MFWLLFGAEASLPENSFQLIPMLDFVFEKPPRESLALLREGIRYGRGQIEAEDAGTNPLSAQDDFFTGFRMLTHLMKNPNILSSTAYVAWQPSQRYPFEIALMVLVDPASRIVTHAGITKSYEWIVEERARKQRSESREGRSHGLPLSMQFHAWVSKQVIAMHPEVRHMLTVPADKMLKIMCQFLPPHAREIGYRGQQEHFLANYNKMLDIAVQIWSQPAYPSHMEAQKAKYQDNPDILAKIEKFEEFKGIIQAVSLISPNMFERAFVLGAFKDNLQFIMASALPKTKEWIVARLEALERFVAREMENAQMFPAGLPDPQKLECTYIDGGLNTMIVEDQPVDLNVCWWFRFPVSIFCGLGMNRFLLTEYTALASFTETSQR